MKRPRSLGPLEELRLLAGMAVQPFLAGAVAFVSFPLLLLDRHGNALAGGVPSDVTDAALSVAIGVALLALLVTIVGVFPTALWLVKRGYVRFTSALLWGLGFGNFPLVLGTVLTGGGYGLAAFIRGVVFSSLIGLAGAAVFWVISIRPYKLNRATMAG